MVNKDGAVKVVDFGSPACSRFEDSNRNADRNFRIHVARAISRRACRRTVRHLVLRCAPLRTALLPAAFHWDYARRFDAQHMFAGRAFLAFCRTLVPADLEIVASRLLQKSPGNRYQSMEDVLLELDPICKALQAESVTGMVTESRELAEHGEFSRARDLLRQALQLDSKNQAARMLLEKVTLSCGDDVIGRKVTRKLKMSRAARKETSGSQGRRGGLLQWTPV